jgi:hypothetical protein
MCRIGDVFTPGELKTLNKKRRDVLQEYGRLIVLTDPAIRNLIKKNPGIRKKLKRLLKPELRRLKSI